MHRHKLTPTDREFVEHIKVKAAKHGCSLELVPKEAVLRDGHRTQAFFDSDKKKLVVATRPPKQIRAPWTSVLAHESSHMDQWIENSFFWNRTFIGDVDAAILIDLWLAGRIVLTRNQVLDYVRRTRDMEWDCERRTVRKLKEHDLPVDIRQYIQQANAYMFMHEMTISHLKSYFFRCSSTESIYKTCPTYFLSREEYNTVPRAFRRAFEAKYGQPRA